jgi:SNF2 family DNA or RNA helicase
MTMSLSESTLDFKLYDFQQEDVDKLRDLKAGGIHSEMGTGKTYEAGELLRRTDTKTLWVGPMGTLRGSAAKIDEMGISKPWVWLDPKNRNDSWRTFQRTQGGIFFAHWEALRLMPELAETSWDMIIADEVHRLQNRKSQQTRALKKIRKVGQKFGMSGTPVTGAPHKYWSYLNWLRPDLFGSYWKFYNQYVDYDIIYPQGFHKITGPKNADKLLEIVTPFTVRHLKKEQCCEHHPEGVMPWLPDKYYDPRYVDLLPIQRKAYNQMKKDLIAWVGKHENQPLVAPIMIAQMIRLQQFAVAYASVGPGGEVWLSEPSSKLDMLMEILEDNEDEPIVVWSQFKQAIYLLEERCKRAKIPILLYTGDNRATRDANVQSFASGGARVFAGTISAGGVGVDGLQKASSTCVFLDRLWSAHLNKQAEDRLWRDGQQNAVQVIDLIARNTVDRGRHQRLELQWGWIKELLGDQH